MVVGYIGIVYFSCLKFFSVKGGGGGGDPEGGTQGEGLGGENFQLVKSIPEP